MGKAKRITTILLIVWMAAGLLAPPAQAADLRPETVAAFDRYVHLTEQRMDNDLRENHFLYIDKLSAARRAKIDAQVRLGDLYIEQLHTLEDGQPIHIPGGQIHHWVGLAFIPQDAFSQTLSVLQDYQNYAQIYKPDVRRSELLERNGNVWKTYMQLYKKSLVSVVLNVNFDDDHKLLSSTRAETRSYSTRIAEVHAPGGPDEHELPVGKDHGYLWRLYSYWRVEAKDGGVYLQIEFIALSRTIPAAFAWLVDPIVRNLSRAVIADLLNATGKAVTGNNPPPAASAALEPPRPLLGGEPDLCSEIWNKNPALVRGRGQERGTLKPSIITPSELMEVVSSRRELSFARES